MNTKVLCPTYPARFMRPFTNTELPESSLWADRHRLTAVGRSLLGDLGSGAEVSGKASPLAVASPHFPGTSFESSDPHPRHGSPNVSHSQRVSGPPLRAECSLWKTCNTPSLYWISLMNSLTLPSHISRWHYVHLSGPKAFWKNSPVHFVNPSPSFWQPLIILLFL